MTNVRAELPGAAREHVPRLICLHQAAWDKLRCWTIEAGWNEAVARLEGHAQGDVLHFDRVERLINRSHRKRRFCVHVPDMALEPEKGHIVALYHSHAAGIVPSAADRTSMHQFAPLFWLIGCAMRGRLVVAGYRVVKGRITSLTIRRNND